MGNKVIIGFVAFAVFFFILNIAWAGGYHIVKKTVVEQTIVEQTIVESSKGVALSAASGQHHYRSTNQLQWSAGAAFINENDDSAVSFGLGKQIGNVFVSGNYGSDGSNSIIGISASGKF